MIDCNLILRTFQKLGRDVTIGPHSVLVIPKGTRLTMDCSPKEATQVGRAIKLPVFVEDKESPKAATSLDDGWFGLLVMDMDGTVPATWDTVRQITPSVYHEIRSMVDDFEKQGLTPAQVLERERDAGKVFYLPLSKIPGYMKWGRSSANARGAYCVWLREPSITWAGPGGYWRSALLRDVQVSE